MIKRLIIVLSILLFATVGYGQTVTDNYELVIPGIGSQDWNGIISRDIISMDKIMGILSADSAVNLDEINIISSDVGVLKIQETIISADSAIQDTNITIISSDINDFYAGGGQFSEMTLLQNSDTIAVTHDGANGLINWSDGNLYLKSNEGANTNSAVYIQGPGTGNAQLYLDDGDGGTALFLNNTNTLSIKLQDGLTDFIINEDGNDINYRFESDDNPNMFYIDGGGDSINIGDDSGDGIFNVIASDANSDFYLDCYSSTSGEEPFVITRKSASNTRGTKVETVDGEDLFTLQCKGTDSSSTDSGACFTIKVEQVGTAGASYVSADVTMNTSSNSSQNTNQFVLMSDGGIEMKTLKSGTDQADAGATTNELYVDTNDDNTLKLGV